MTQAIERFSFDDLTILSIENVDFLLVTGRIVEILL